MVFVFGVKRREWQVQQVNEAPIVYENLDFENERESGQLGNLSGEMVEVYDKSGKLAGTIDRSQIGELPEGYIIK